MVDNLMSIYSTEYRRKLTTPEQAAVTIGQGATLVHGMAIGEPPALLAAIAQRVRIGDLEDLKVFSLLPMQHASRTILAPHLLDKIQPFCWFLTAYDRDLVKRGLNYFVPNEFHQIPRLSGTSWRVDVTVTTVTPWITPGFSPSAR